MKSTIKHTVAAITIAITALSSCTSEPFQPLELEEQSLPAGQEIILTATLEGSDAFGQTPGTRTSVENGGAKVSWAPYEVINVFQRDQSARFVSTNKEPAAVAEFRGTLSSVVGACEGSQGGDNSIWAVYPRSTSDDFISSSGQIIKDLSAIQNGVAGTFAPNTQITAAHSEGLDLAFYNVTGGIRFSITKPGVTMITLQGNGFEQLADRRYISFKDGIPVTESYYSQSTLDTSFPGSKIVLLAPSGGVFETGVWYYFVTWPVSLPNGFKITLHHYPEVAEFVTSSPVEIKRGVFGSLPNLDENLEFKMVEDGYVDMGAGVQWASCNLGATQPQEIGNYYAWAETAPKEIYDWSTYKWCNGSANTLTRYNSSEEFGSAPDYESSIYAKDDAARLILGAGWTIPNSYAVNRLLNEKNTEAYWDSMDGVNGFRFVSKVEGYEGNSIFIPASGFKFSNTVGLEGAAGGFWLDTRDGTTPSSALSLNLSEGSATIGFTDRAYGLPIRPVRFVSNMALPEPKSNNPFYINGFSAGGSYGFHSSSISFEESISSAQWLALSSDETVVKSADVYNTSMYCDIVGPGSASISLVHRLTDQRVDVPITVKIKEPEAVDLGLSVKWADMNLGAPSELGGGYFFSWSEVEPFLNWTSRSFRDDAPGGYSTSSMRYYEGGKKTKYCKGRSDGVDEKEFLDPEDDPATVNLGNGWRVPSPDEWEELFNNCIVEEYVKDMVLARKFTSKKDASKYIIIPHCGYMSGTSGPEEFYHSDAYYMTNACYDYYQCWSAYFNHYNNRGIARDMMFYGFPVRPVKD